jgi:penicillin-binding protein 1A
VRLARELGPKAVAEVSRRIGIDPGPDPDPGFVLGTFSTSPLAMAAAYASVANGGYAVSPIGVLAAIDGRGEVRANYLDRPRTRILSPRCVGEAREILREVVRNGTGRAAGLRRGEAYGKTGTTTGNADAWFVGWSGDRVLGIWMGRRRDLADGIALAGGGPPATLFRRIQEAATEDEARRRAKDAPARTAGREGLEPSVPRSTTGLPDRRATQAADAQPARSPQVPLPPTRPRGEGWGNS